jgi:tRNA (guanine-N7-)-methyltransferase
MNCPVRAPASLAGVHVWFPVTGHPKRHRKRRLIQAAFVAGRVDHPAPGAYLHSATDGRPLTKFEQRGLQAFHGVWDLVFGRREGARGPVGMA